MAYSRGNHFLFYSKMGISTEDIQDSTDPTRKREIVPRYIPVSLFFLLLMVIGIVGFSFQKGLEMITVYAPLLNADTEIKLNVSVAHMLVEEILAGDTTKSIEDVEAALDRAGKNAQAMLDGGEYVEQVIVPLEDIEIRRMMSKVIQELKEFRAIAEHRLSHRESSLTGSPIDYRYDKVYSIFTENVDQIKFRLMELISDDLKYFKATQYILVIVCVIISVGIWIALYRFEYFRNRVVRALHRSNENLEVEIEERIATEGRLIKSKEQLRGLSNQLQTVREEEKAHIAREVHDELGQTLTALKMELGCLNHDLNSVPVIAQQRIGGMNKLIDNTIESVQRIATELRPQILDVLGLGEAMRWETLEFEKRTGIKCQVQWSPSSTELNREIKITVFRIFQEAMTNISRHSAAKNVTVDLQVDALQVALEIHDNGKGIATDEIFNENSLGLLGIRERVYFLNGRFDITGNEGTLVQVTIPLEQHGSIN
ncbi:MAG: sensor histidine kinase [Nitrospinaceae bacterium]|jgi:signal transduction histidine kinase|nr:sensor histidine kinase [Nitrospinaceae bacterium]